MLILNNRLPIEIVVFRSKINFQTDKSIFILKLFVTGKSFGFLSLSDIAYLGLAVFLCNTVYNLYIYNLCIDPTWDLFKQYIGRARAKPNFPCKHTDKNRKYRVRLYEGEASNLHEPFRKV